MLSDNPKTRQLQLERRVQKGIARLKREDPECIGRLDVEKLDVKNTCSCPLGQLYGNYGSGMEALHIRAPYLYGFDVKADEFDDVHEWWNIWYALNCAWKTCLTEEQQNG